LTVSGITQILPEPPLSVEGPPSLQLSPELKEFREASNVGEIVALAREVVADPTYPTARARAAAGQSPVGFFPVYTPQEIAHALGFLPVSLHGGGENIEVSHADAPLGSFLCSISKTTLELALTHQLDEFSGFVFPYICDVSRNLEGIFSRVLPDRMTHMLHLPQNFSTAAAVPFLTAEYRRLVAKLEKVSGAHLTAELLRGSLLLFNRQRRLLEELAVLKRDEPWKVSIQEYYLLRRLGGLLPRELHVRLLRKALPELRARGGKPKDAIRVVVVGPFCEQPTLDLLSLVEEVGCYVVWDELQPLHSWCPTVETRGDPLEALARAYVSTPVDLGVRATPTTKAEAILGKVDRAQAQAVLFLTAKFCEPALEDVVLYRRGLDSRKIPYLHLEFEERSTTYEQARLQLETFVESIMFD
jgi:benzoyl-CoA reductase subunit C